MTRYNNDKRCPWCGTELKELHPPVVGLPNDDNYALCNDCLEVYYQAVVLYVLKYEISDRIDEVNRGDRKIKRAVAEVIQICTDLLRLHDVLAEESYSELAKRAMKIRNA